MKEQEAGRLRRKRITITEWEMKMSPRALDRLRVMYSFDIMSRYHNSNGKLGDLLFADNLDPDWLTAQDNFRSMGRAIPNSVMKGLKGDGDETTWGAWKVRRSKKSVIIEAPIARIPLNALRKVSHRIELTRRRQPTKQDESQP